MQSERMYSSLRNRQAPVERDEGVAGADACRLDLEVLELVCREQCYAVAGLHAARPQRGAEAADAVVDLPEREATAVTGRRDSPGCVAGAPATRSMKRFTMLTLVAIRSYL